MTKLRATLAGTMLSLCLIQAAQAGNANPTGNFNTFTFSQQGFNFDGVNTTVVGHLSLGLTVINAGNFPIFLDIAGVPPSGSVSATPGAPFATTLLLQPSTTGCTGNSFSFNCLLTGDISFVGPGDVYGGAVFGATGTLSWDNGTLGNPDNARETLDTDSSRFLAAAPSSVPEPVSLALLGAGLAGLGFARRRAARRG